MEKQERSNLMLLGLAALIGLLGSYSANYIFAFFSNTEDKGVYHIIGISSVILFFVLVMLIKKIAESE